MSGSSVDAALLALVNRFTTAAPSGVAVFDGEPRDTKTRQFLAVGWDESDEPAVRSTSASSTYGYSEQESADISCLLSCWAGNQAGATVRSSTFALFDTFAAALAADRELGGAVMTSGVTDKEYLTAKLPQGALAQVRFTVHFESSI